MRTLGVWLFRRSPFNAGLVFLLDQELGTLDLFIGKRDGRSSIRKGWQRHEIRSTRSQLFRNGLGCFFAKFVGLGNRERSFIGFHMPTNHDRIRIVDNNRSGSHMKVVIVCLQVLDRFAKVGNRSNLLDKRPHRKCSDLEEQSLFRHSGFVSVFFLKFLERVAPETHVVNHLRAVGFVARLQCHSRRTHRALEEEFVEGGHGHRGLQRTLPEKRRAGFQIGDFEK